MTTESPVAPAATSSPPERRPSTGTSDVPSGLSFAFLTQPSVQGIRFVQKLLLVHFLVPAELGDANFAGMLIFAGSQAAAWGMDQVPVVWPALDGRMVEKIRHLLFRNGLIGMAITAAVALVAGMVAEYRSLSWMLLAMAPVVFISNAGILPTALLVRHRRYRRLFAVDIGATVVQAAVTVLGARQGFGAWAVVAGWYASNVITTLSARTLARKFAPDATEPETNFNEALESGRHYMGATVFGYAAERVDPFAVRLVLGATDFGTYDLALHLSQSFLTYAANVIQRFLLPTLAAGKRRNRPPTALTRLIRQAALLVLPASAGLALLVYFFADRLFPERWAAVPQIAVISCAAAAARCLDLVGQAALKAAGCSKPIFLNEVAKTAVLVFAVLIGLRFGLQGVAIAVVFARIIGAAITWSTGRGIIVKSP